MKCAKCGVENRETAKFCRDCGAKLEPVSNMAAPVDPDQTVLLNSDDEPADTPQEPAEQEQTVLLDTEDSAKDTPEALQKCRKVYKKAKQCKNRQKGVRTESWTV